MAFNCLQFRDLITRVLKEVALYSPAAVNLLLGTAAQESGFGTYLRQVKGPALSVFQIEEATFLDLRERMHPILPVYGLLFGAVLGLVMGGIALVARGDSRFPFGPALSLGAMTAVWLHEPILRGFG